MLNMGAYSVSIQAFCGVWALRLSPVSFAFLDSFLHRQDVRLRFPDPFLCCFDVGLMLECLSIYLGWLHAVRHVLVMSREAFPSLRPASLLRVWPTCAAQAGCALPAQGALHPLPKARPVGGS